MAEDTPFTLATRTAADPDAKRQQFLDTFEGGLDNFTATPGSPTWLLGDATGEIAADLEQVALVDRTAAYAEWLGTYIFALPRITASPAGGTSTWLLSGVGSGGAVIPEGTPVRAGGVNFHVRDDFPVPAGATAAEGLPITCDLAGELGNNLTGELEVLAALPFVLMAELDGPTGGGVDGETQASYLVRFAEELQHLGRPTLPGDFAAKLRRIPGIYRVLAIPGYVPADPVAGTPARTAVGKAIYLLAVDRDGNDPTDAELAAGAAYLASQREPNWIINVRKPPRADFAISASFTTWPGYDPAEVKVRGEAALLSFAASATWGAPPSGEVPVWNDEPIVYRSEINAALNAVDGLRRVPNGSILINGLDADLALPQPGGLPGTVTATLTPVAG